MKFEEFLNLLDTGDIPDNIPSLLQALLLDGMGAWDGAHSIAQIELTRDGSWVHAYLHRVEGDMGNASYWYSSAGRKMPDMTLQEEWETIVRELLGRDKDIGD